MNSRAKLTIVITAALTLLASPTTAQDNDGTIDEIIVTATKRELPVQGVPINISAFEEDRLREGNLFDITRLSQEVPGLNVIDYGAETHRDIVLRGLNATRLQIWSDKSRTTSIYVNDTVIDYTHFDINDVARVEVLRGPQGTLYGGGAVGGTIRYVTNKPDPNRFAGWVEAGMSSFEASGDSGWQTKAVVNAPLIDDKLALRVFAGYKETPGYITKVGYPDRPGLPAILKEDQNSNDRLDVRAALRWIMNDDVEATVAYTGQRLNTFGNSGATPGVGDAFTGVGGIVDESTDENIDLFTLDVVADFDFAEFTSNTAYHDERRPRAQDQTRFILEISEAVGLSYELFPQYIEGFIGKGTTTRFTQEFRLVSMAPESAVEYVAGAFYEEQTDKEVGNHNYAPGLPNFLNEFYFGPGATSDRPDDFEFLGQLNTESTELALFGEVTINLTDRWNVVLGGRWFDHEISGEVDVAFPLDEEIFDKFGEPGCAPTQGGTDPTLFPCTLEHTVMDNQVRDFVYKINTSYQFDRADALLFATIAEGFRPGGANYVNSVQAAVIDPRFLGYDPDKATSYEIGVKSMLLDERLKFNTSIYHIDWEDIQLATRVGVGFEAIVNGDDARINGIELDLTALISDSMSLDLSVTRLDAELSADTVKTPEIDGQKGDRLPGSAELQASLALRYEMELANSTRWWTRLAGNYSGDVTAYLNDNQFNQLISPPELSENRFFDRMPSYTVWNLTTGVEREQWSLFAFVDNLFDEKYIIGT
ncbi:MAG: TonB-dependent receptor, partial [Gammaproteobacteria bacterium]|nr:TonB-dependent receptor [Gammaproteobacteria bacterium]